MASLAEGGMGDWGALVDAVATVASFSSFVAGGVGVVFEFHQPMVKSALSKYWSWSYYPEI